MARVAVPGPSPGLLDYLIPAHWQTDSLVGCRVQLPFRNQSRIGLVVEINAHSSIAIERLRELEQRIDDQASIPAELVELLRWCWRYYHHPPGEVLTTATPKHWRAGKPPPPPPQLLSTTEAGEQKLGDAGWRRRASAMAGMLEHCRAKAQAANTLPGSAQQRRRLLEKGWLSESQSTPDWSNDPVSEGPELMAQQASAVDAVASAQGFSPFLLLGVTGSGKTEVYLRLIAQALQRRQQVLMLVPEIGLTPQLQRRIEQRFPHTNLAVWTSAHSAGMRWQAWDQARSGYCPIVLGTRSAVFLPFANLGLIIVDEEHDASLKQQDGFRYHARDLAVVRGRQMQIPVVLGSATPSLETLRNVERGQYRQLNLSQRAGGEARQGQTQLIDLRQQPLTAGLSPALLTLVEQHLERGEQVLLFLNRRGYAPVLLCHHCGWHADCPSCDARLTLHRRRGLLICHHCGHRERLPSRCPSCHSKELLPVGQGTEQLENVLQERFPDVDILRFDRDAVRGRHAMEQQLDRVRQAENDKPMLLVGTQMLAKGHHWPRLTLVGVVDSDALLFSSDFRASERLAQLMVQLAGRAGRAKLAGTVVLQTHQPQHPVWQALMREGYRGFARQALSERAAAGFPPYGYMALLEADAVEEQALVHFCSLAAQRFNDLATGEPPVHLLGPAPASMQRRAGRHHYQLLLLCQQRQPLHKLLNTWLAEVARLPGQHRVHWCVDVDPLQVG